MVIAIHHKPPNIWIIPLRVTPKGGKNILLPLTLTDTALKIKVSAPPENGAANEAIIQLLSKALAIPKSRIQIVKGETSRQKMVLIEASLSQEECIVQLAQVAKAEPEWFQVVD